MDGEHVVCAGRRCAWDSHLLDDQEELPVADAGTDAQGDDGHAAGIGVTEQLPGEPSGRTFVARGLEAVGLTLGSALVVALVWQWLDVYLTFFGVLPEPTPSDGVRYVVTATAAVTLIVVGFLAGLAAGHQRVAGLGAVLLVIALAAAFLLAVPADRWARQPADGPAPGYEPCFSGSGDCVGG